MDINFHYYAVKALAIKAEFPEHEAQAIASYSQFVDDFDETGSVLLEYVPEWARYLTVPGPGGSYWFTHVTTGFNSWFNMAMLTLEENQRWIVMPFHFIPRAPLNTLPNRIDWRVIPARMDTDSLIRDMLIEARTTLLHGAVADRQTNLMRIGMLLHIFADTYAHQRFSGFWGWENHSYLTNVTNNINGADETSSYWPNSYWSLPSIGHTNVGHAPDDSNVRFTMKQRLNENDNYSASLTRSNTECYCDAAKEILNYLRSCRGLGEISLAAWDTITINLSHGFLTTSKDVPTLNNHWHTLFPETAFHYNDAPMRNKPQSVKELTGESRMAAEAFGVKPIVFATKSDMWYRYNVIADQIRVRANGAPHHDPLHEAMKAAVATKGSIPFAEDGEE